MEDAELINTSFFGGIENPVSVAVFLFEDVYRTQEEIPVKQKAGKAQQSISRFDRDNLYILD